ncbi:hypothetical protein GGX14DRAFT_696527 [Mycena pura]|uniref:Uncharacterized protein n=1 Tax=Mycena pura TaxID=153505 RepID=A0AAD6VJL0_9AGAR|nr:hypothetical protein GGX14DRAFT_696527 [Mycena pura]
MSSLLLPAISLPDSFATITSTTGDTTDATHLTVPGTASSTGATAGTGESSLPTTGAATTHAAPATSTMGYKGKALRSWPQLPPEVIRLIATHYLQVVSNTTPLPAGWDSPFGFPRRLVPFQERMIYLAVRDTRDMEVIMSVCPKWGEAIEAHNFWNGALSVFDPQRNFDHYGWITVPQPSSQHSSAAPPPAVRATPYRHFRNLLIYSCLPCRLNAPRMVYGLGMARRSWETPRLGHISVCKEHYDRRRARWCAVCLKDGDIARASRHEALRMAREELARAEHAVAHLPRWSPDLDEAAMMAAMQARQAAYDAVMRAQRAEEEGTHFDGGVADNEDEDVFPGVHATCRACRAEWLWRFALLATGVARDPAAVRMGLPVPASALDPVVPGSEPLTTLGCTTAAVGVFNPLDSLVRAAVSAFLELGEGSVNQVLTVAGERAWLRTETRWTELMGQALAARRFNSGGGGAFIAEQPLGWVQPEPTRRRERSVSPESVDGDDHDVRRASQTDVYANNAANAAAYARAGYTTSTDEYDVDEEYEDDSEADDEYEDEEAELAAALEMNVKEMALGDWARGRVLDGAWVAPADAYYGVRVAAFDNPESSVQAVHPVAWAISPPGSPPSNSTSSPTLSTPSATTETTETRHPGPPTQPPPTSALAEAAHTAHIRQMRTVLLPPLRNIVRRVVVECALDADEACMDAHAPRPLDPAMRAARMTLADVVRELREEEGVWFDGVDWSERRRNARLAAAAAAAAQAEVEATSSVRTESEDGRSRGDGSDDSSEAMTPQMSDTSPALSTSTLGTTPSPPPPGETRKDKDRDAQAQQQMLREMRGRQPTIAVMPVLNQPRMLHPIPYVPETIAHLPPYSLEALRAVWREACAPLYHCRCSICERAMAAAQAAQGANPAKAAPSAPLPAKDTTTTTYPDGPWVVQIPAEDEPDAGHGAESVVSLVENENDHPGHGDEMYEGYREADGKLVIPLDGVEMEREEDEEALWDDAVVSEWGGSSEGDGEEEEEAKYALGPTPAAWVAGAGTGRKRSVDELEPDADSRDADGSRGGTPPKRARTLEPLAKRRSEEVESRPVVKRRSEELEGAEPDTAGNKRARVKEGDATSRRTATPSRV